MVGIMSVFRKNRTVVVLIALGLFSLAFFFLFPRPPADAVSRWGGRTMGTSYEVQLAGVTVPHGALGELKKKVDAELVALNEAMSTYMPGSEISRFNRSAAGLDVEVGERFRTVLSRAEEVSVDSGGAFDPTVGPLVDLWGFGAGEAVEGEPTEAEISERLARTGMERVRLQGQVLSKARDGVELNLSAIAKGYAVDRVMGLLVEEGFAHIYVEIGGEVACRGVNASGVPWRVGVQTPRDHAEAGAVKVVSLHNRALATSGDYRNFVDTEGGRRHHIIDPRTGRPAEHRLASVSVLARDCMTADAAATALYVMGTKEGLAWVEARPELEALFIDRVGEGFEIMATEGFNAALVAVP